MPKTDATLRPDLGAIAYDYSMGAAKAGFIGHLVLPVFPTPLKSGQYPKIPAEAILEVAETIRAPRTAYARGDWDFEFTDYSCSENGWEEPLDDTEAALYRSYFDAETMAVERATLMVMRSQERRVASKVMNEAIFPNAAAKKPWKSYADADPLGDINKAKDSFRDTVGLKPNSMILDESILRHVSMCDAVMDRIKYSSPNAIRGELTLEQLKAYFSVDNIFVASAVINAAPRNAAKKVEPIWPTNKIMLACVSSGGADLKEPSLGRTFLWTGDSPQMLTTEEYREEQTRSAIYRVRQHTDECIQFTGAGFLLTGVC